MAKSRRTADEIYFSEVRPRLIAAEEANSGLRREMTPLDELLEDSSDLLDQGQASLKTRAETSPIDESKLGEVVRSYIGEKNIRDLGNLKTKDLNQFAGYIVAAFLDYTQRQKGFGFRVHSRAGISSGRMNHLHFDAWFNERVVGRGTYETRYSTGFDEAHDDSDKTTPDKYQSEQLGLLRDNVRLALPIAEVLIKDRALYLFKKS